MEGFKYNVNYDESGSERIINMRISPFNETLLVVLTGHFNSDGSKIIKKIFVY